MAFLQLNNITIPVQSMRQSTEEIGERQRSFSGKYGRDVRARKRSWEVTTTLLTRTEAAAIKGLVEGLGDQWRFEEDTYSDKGLASSSTEAIAFEKSHLGDDGESISRQSTSPYFPFDGNGVSSKCGYFPAADYSNILTSPSYSAFNSAIVTTSSTAQFYTSPDSTRVIPTGGASIDGVRISSATGALNTSYTGHAYIFNAEVTTSSFRIYIEDTANADTGSFHIFSIPAQSWGLATVDYTTVGAGSTPSLDLIVSNTSSSNDTFHVDDPMIAQGTDETRVYVPSSVTADTHIYDIATNFNYSGFSFFVQVDLSIARTVFSSQTIFTAYESPTSVARNRIDLLITASGGLTLQVIDMDGNSYSATIGFPSLLSSYGIAGSVRQDPSDGEDEIILYQDAFSSATATISAPERFNVGDLTNISLGSFADYTVTPLKGSMDNMWFMNAPMTRTQVQATAARGLTSLTTDPRDLFPQHPNIVMKSDSFTHDIVVTGELNDSNHGQGAADADGWENTREQVSFTLYEV